MSYFLYAMPAERSDDFNKEAAGATALGNISVRMNTIGFEDQPVALCIDDAAPAQMLSLNKEKQTWRKIGNRWLGYWTDNPPTPETLALPKQLRGKAIGDWLVPTAVSFDEVDGEIFAHHHLSRYVDFAEDGSLKYGDVEQQFAPLYEVAMGWMETSETGWTLAELWNAAALTMSFNYRVGIHELCMLGFLTDATAEQVMNICVDTEGVTSLFDTEKKSSTDDSSNITVGDPEGTASTSQPQLTS